MVTYEERKSFGWLGKVPPEISSAGIEVVQHYKDLAKEAKIVARMAPTQRKVDRAKEIERRYYEILDTAKKQARERRLNLGSVD